MEGYIDIHSHILPGIDDGSQNIEQTLSMLKIAYSEGIHTIIVTPHFHEGWSMPPVLDLEDVIKKVRSEISSILPDITLYLGNEIYYSHDCINQLNQKNILTLAGSRYVLVEFSVIAESRYIKNSLQEFLLNGYIPILAHIERYENLVKDLKQVFELIEMGAYIQVNAMSITGENGRAYKRITRKLLKNNLVHFIATDSHSDGEKSPRLKKCAAFLTKKYGQGYAQELLIDNQKKIIANQYI